MEPEPPPRPQPRDPATTSRAGVRSARLAVRVQLGWARGLRRLRVRFGRRPGELLWSLGVLAAVGLSYAAVNRFNAWRGVEVWSPETPWDRALPAVSWMWPVYLGNLAFYPLLAGLGPATPRVDRERARTLWALLGIQVLSLVLFLLFPCEVRLREQLPADPGPWTGAVRTLLHGLDAPWNAWPSLHVSHTLVLALWARRALRAGPAPGPGSAAGTGGVSRGDARDGPSHATPAVPGPGMRAAAVLPLLLWVSVAASIVLVKQHYLFDLVTGSALGAVVARALDPGWRRALGSPPSGPVG